MFFIFFFGDCLFFLFFNLVKVFSVLLPTWKLFCLGYLLVSPAAIFLFDLFVASVSQTNCQPVVFLDCWIFVICYFLLQFFFTLNYFLALFLFFFGKNRILFLFKIFACMLSCLRSKIYLIFPSLTNTTNKKSLYRNFSMFI